MTPARMDFSISNDENNYFFFGLKEVSEYTTGILFFSGRGKFKFLSCPGKIFALNTLGRKLLY